MPGSQSVRHAFHFCLAFPFGIAGGVHIAGFSYLLLEGLYSEGQYPFVLPGAEQGNPWPGVIVGNLLGIMMLLATRRDHKIHVVASLIKANWKREVARLDLVYMEHGLIFGLVLGMVIAVPLAVLGVIAPNGCEGCR